MHSIFFFQHIMFFISIISLLTTLSTVATNPVLRNEIWDDSNTLSSFDDVIDDSLVLANYDVQTDRDILSANEASSYSPSYKGNKYTTSDELLLSSNSCLSGPKAGSKPGGMCIKKPQCTNYDDDTRGLLNQKRSLVCCEGGYVTYAQARAKCIHCRFFFHSYLPRNNAFLLDNWIVLRMIATQTTC